MNFQNFLCSFLMLGSCLAIPRTEASTVFTDGVTVGPFSLFPPPSYQISASVDPGGTGNLGELLVSIDGSSLVLTSEGGSLGIGSDWFVVSQGTEIGPGLVNTGTLLGGTIGGNHFGSQLQLQASVPFLVGFWLDSGGTPGLPGKGDRFGWAAMVYRPATGLVLVDSATSISDGIIAGTTTTVPEPSTTLLGIATCGLVSVRRRR
jgi:hypothetical protein